MQLTTIVLGLAGLFLTGFGLFMEANRDFAWRWTQWRNAAQGLDSKRTEQWEKATTIGNLFTIFGGIFLIVIAILLEIVF